MSLCVGEGGAWILKKKTGFQGDGENLHQIQPQYLNKNTVCVYLQTAESDPQKWSIEKYKDKEIDSFKNKWSQDRRGKRKANFWAERWVKSVTYMSSYVKTPTTLQHMMLEERM